MLSGKRKNVFTKVAEILKASAKPPDASNLYYTELADCPNPKCRSKKYKHSVNYICGLDGKGFCSSCIKIGEGTGTIRCPEGHRLVQP